jgi:type I restriction enzyme, S subunit
VLGDLVERIFVPPRFKHIYGEEGVAYLDSAQLVEVAPDIDKWILSLDTERQLGYTVSAGTLLIPCSGQLHGIIGSVVIADAWHEGKILNNHVMRLIPKRDPDVRLGYLRTVIGHPRLGRPRVVQYAFGSSVPELLPADIADLSVPRLDRASEASIADHTEAAARLRSEADQLEDRIQSLAEGYVQEFLRGHGEHFE